MAGMVAIAKRTLDIETSAANKPMKTCSARMKPKPKRPAFPARSAQPDTITIQLAIEMVRTGLLPN